MNGSLRLIEGELGIDVVEGEIPANLVEEATKRRAELVEKIVGNIFDFFLLLENFQLNYINLFFDSYNLVFISNNLFITKIIINNNTNS